MKHEINQENTNKFEKYKITQEHTNKFQKRQRNHWARSVANCATFVDQILLAILIFQHLSKCARTREMLKTCDNTC